MVRSSLAKGFGQRPHLLGEIVSPPTKVVRVWLIANTMFKQREGRCAFGSIELISGETVLTVN